jgi:predicted O-methyltransferase YrrM
MRTFHHWSPTYIRRRIIELRYRRRHPDLPWLTPAGNDILAARLDHSDIGLEMGSGRSTLWFAKRTRYLTSIEDDAIWYGRVESMLREASQDNVTLRLIPKDVPDSDGSRSAYVRAIRDVQDPLDYVLIDGAYRDHCAVNVTSKIRPGGMLIVDNANWFLPSDSISPRSRTLAQGPGTPTWMEFQLSVSCWQRIWTSSGVNDTAFFFKPV